MSGPPRYRGDFADDDRGQSEVIGVVLILAIAVLGITAVVFLGAAAVQDTERSAQLSRVEHGMTMLDAKVAMVALGEADAQTVDLRSGSGGYTVKDSSGWIRIRHENYSGNDRTEIIYWGDLGSVAYTSGDTTIAYQGGGVWRTKGDGTVMISPPEFHYRDATLTLPVIRVAGSGAISGEVEALVTPNLRDRKIYPNLTTTGGSEMGAPYNVTNAAYRNPVQNGTVNVTIKSEHFRGWASYFRQRTDGDVTVNPDEQTASLKLLTIGTVGQFGMPPEGESIKLRGVRGGHPAETFTLTLFHDDSDSAKFSNLQWSLYADEGPEHFELHLRDGSGGTCGGDVQATVYYSQDSGSTYQGWHDDDAFQYECEADTGADWNGDGDSDDLRLKVNFTSTSLLTYQDLASDELMHFNPNGDLRDPLKWYETHNNWEETTTITPGDTNTFNNITDHYFSLMGPNFDLTVDDKSSNTVNEEGSSGNIELEGTGSQFITYLHVTENEVDVELE